MKNSKIFLAIAIIAIITIMSKRANTQSGKLIEIGSADTLYSEILGEDREFWIQFPQYYDPSSATTYPVIYVLDGSVHMKAVATVHDYYSGGFFPEMIIVGISNRTHRTRDLTTSSITTRRGQTYHQENGGADNFIKFMGEELIPYIDRKYPTNPYRTLVGHSYAGLFTVNAFVKHTDLFANYLAIDPSLDWDDQRLLNEAGEVLKSKDLEGTSIFVSLSGQLHLQDYDITIDNVMEDTSEYTLFSRSIIEFGNLLKDAGVRSDWKFYKDDLHGTVPLPSLIYGLRFLFNWYPIEGTDKFNRPDTPLSELVELVEERARTLERNFGFSVPPFEEGLFNMLGYMNMDMGNEKKSLAFFEMATTYYPNSANAHDSLGEAYANLGDNQAAIEHYKKSLDIDPNNTNAQEMVERLEKK